MTIPRNPRRSRLPESYYLAVVAMVSPDGHRVEQILLQRHLDLPPKPMLRVRRGTYYVADCASVAEVARYVELASLMPEPRPSYAT